ncbi:MAG: DUF1573 domain-containing protein [Candidatus Melainabacteria bacterium]|nr:DUF1573 domain-containing protein [Candidatus Melainabacteria bacterium]
MKSRKALTLGLGLLIISLLAFALYFYQTKNKAVLRLDALSKNLGHVEEGKDLVADFTFFNDGLKPLRIFDVKSDCGCTDLSWKSAEIPPGKSSHLTVHIDTTMKQGAVTKQIRFASNDPDFSFGALNMQVDVENLHTKGNMTEGGRAKIFTDEKCAHCHVDMGVGAFGKELFEADCAMCHRVQKESKILVGPELEALSFNTPAQIARLREVISFGSKTHRSMPGFLDKAGGPLAKEQVDSLVDYLKSIKH